MSIEDLKKRKKGRTAEERKAASDRMHAKRREAERLGELEDKRKEKDLASIIKKQPKKYNYYSDELADTVCELIANGTSFKELDKIDGIPDSSTIIRWAFRNEGGTFSEKYNEAQKTRIYRLAHETLNIADDSQGDQTCDDYGNVKQDHEYVNRSKLRIDTRKWLASKLLHNIFGEKLEVVGKGDTAIVPTVNINVKKIEE